MKIPKKLIDNPDPKKLKRLERFYNLFYPLSALEVAEFLGKSVGSVRNYYAGRKIPEVVFNIVSRRGVIIHIRYAEVKRQVPSRVLAGDDKAYSKKLIKIVKIRLKKDLASKNQELNDQAEKTMKELR